MSTTETRPADARSVAELPAVLKVDEAAAFLRCDSGTLYALIREGELPVVRLGRTFRITRDTLARFVDGANA